MNKNKIKARKSWGQNFLIESKVISLIVDNVFMSEKNNYVEIGSGRGALTIPLSSKIKNLTCIEIDQELIDYLKTKLDNKANFINKDVLKVDWSLLINQDSVVFGNLPYYITTEILEKIFLSSHLIKKAVIMIQKDVAHKILGLGKGKKMSYLGLLLNAVFKIDIVVDVSKNSFIPKPKVDSCVLKLTPKTTYSSKELSNLQTFLVAILKQRRKTILNNLKPLELSEQKMNEIAKHVNLDLRIEDLDLAKILNLFELTNRS
jgi:16S rRNA (adenine1518-N6/adenine1519-N6)-dimethyltransferase